MAVTKCCHTVLRYWQHLWHAVRQDFSGSSLWSEVHTHESTPRRGEAGKSPAVSFRGKSARFVMTADFARDTWPQTVRRHDGSRTAPCTTVHVAKGFFLEGSWRPSHIIRAVPSAAATCRCRSPRPTSRTRSWTRVRWPAGSYTGPSTGTGAAAAGTCRRSPRT